MSVSIDTDNTLLGSDVTLVKEYLSIASDNTDHDENLKLWINSVSWWFSVETGGSVETRRQLKSKSLTEYYDGDGSRSLIPDNYPVTAITGIWDDDGQTFGNDNLIASSDYRIVNRGKRIELYSNVFTYGQRNIKMTYTAGYTTIPWDLQNAALELLRMHFQDGEEKRAGLTQRSLADGSIAFVPTKLPEMVQKVVERYSRHEDIF